MKLKILTLFITLLILSSCNLFKKPSQERAHKVEKFKSVDYKITHLEDSRRTLGLITYGTFNYKGNEILSSFKVPPRPNNPNYIIGDTIKVDITSIHVRKENKYIINFKIKLNETQ